MKILFIAPLPPPITGHSLVSQVLLDDLARDHDVAVVNLSKDSFADGAATFSRVTEVLGILRRVWTGRRNATHVYLTISESLLGNIKDLLIYAICWRMLDRMCIHLHGGSIKRLLWDRRPWIFRLNRLFIRRMGSVIVSGESHSPIFSGLLPTHRVHIVPNFAQDYVFADSAEIAAKFRQIEPVRILYVSNFIPKKGYNELLDAFLMLDEEARARIRIDFCGRFDAPGPEQAFRERIRPHPQLEYHGIVDDARKRELFVAAHVFCLPTSFFEGQPISILEAYAAGCVVVTTGQPGILDIFTPEVNGFEIEPQSPASIVPIMQRLIAETEMLETIAEGNHRLARARYRVGAYAAGVRAALLGSKAALAPAIQARQSAGARG